MKLLDVAVADPAQPAAPTTAQTGYNSYNPYGASQTPAPTVPDPYAQTVQPPAAPGNRVFNFDHFVKCHFSKTGAVRHRR